MGCDMTAQILVGDVLSRIRDVPDEIVQSCVTSPPYFNQRDYGVSGQIGLERTPEEYVEKLVEVFSQVRRTLRKDGTIWINIGDSYAAGGKGGGGSFVAECRAWRGAAAKTGWRAPPPGLKQKDLIGIPWMLAFALRRDGWWLRADHVWGKPNCMPESVEDRTTRSHEYVFHLSKSDRYFYDAEAVRTAPKAESVTRLARSIKNEGEDHILVGADYAPPGQGPNSTARRRRSDKQRGHTRRHAGFNDRWDAMERAQQQMDGANLRSIWWIAPAQFPGAHFAVMPDLVAEICIRASTPQGGVVLDPFGGAGTVGVVADRLQRDSILVELNPDYAEIARKRIVAESPLMAEVKVA